MVDYLYSVNIQANSFYNNMAYKTVWRINRGQITQYSLYQLKTNLVSNWLEFTFIQEPEEK